jgi:sialic acid synthase SpsE
MEEFFKNRKKNICNTSTYFIADIAANHDGSLKRAKKLIRLAAKAGANAAKFQHFKAETIVSDYGFKKLGKISHQAKWKKSVFQVYKDASINFKWTSELYKECKKNNIDFMTSPYDLEYVDEVERYISAYKIGSGDITWKEILNKIEKKNKPIILATGASNLNEVNSAVKILTKRNKIVLMQCNTNYTNSTNNLDYINLNVLKNYSKKFKNRIILGLSDHTQGHVTVLGAVALGAKYIEKHFTDDNFREGPDHLFSMNPKTWKDMVKETKKLERSMGNGLKVIEKNERESVVVQRRAAYAFKFIPKDKVITKKDIIFLRPCPKKSFTGFEEKKIYGKKAKKNIKKGELINFRCIV